MEPDEYTRLFDRETRHWFAVGRRDLLAAVIKEFTTAASLKILEIGSGTGGNVPMLSSFGPVTCIEMSERARTLTKSRLGDDVDVRGGSWPSTNCLAHDEMFNLVVFLDVLEHMDDPLSALVSATRHLLPGGVVVITVPAYQWMWSVHDVKLHHKRRYTLPVMVDLVAEAGLRPVYKTYFNTILFPIAAVARLASRVFAPNASPGQDVPRPYVNSTMRAIFRQEVRWIGRKSAPFGLSVLLVAKGPSNDSQAY